MLRLRRPGGGNAAATAIPPVSLFDRAEHMARSGAARALGLNETAGGAPLAPGRPALQRLINLERRAQFGRFGLRAP